MKQMAQVQDGRTGRMGNSERSNMTILEIISMNIDSHVYFTRTFSQSIQNEDSRFLARFGFLMNRTEQDFSE